MRIVAWTWWMGLALWLGCGSVPEQVSGPGDGDDASTSTGSSPQADPEGPGPAAEGTAGGTGSASGSGRGPDGDTTAGVHADTTTGGAGMEGSTGLEGTSTTEGRGPAESSGGPPSPSCDELYGEAPGYQLCEETDDECHFNANTNGGNCTQMCSMLGGTCLAAFDNSDACTIIPPNMDTCDTNRTTEICVCDK